MTSGFETIDIDVQVGDTVEIRDGTGIVKIILQRPGENVIRLRVRTEGEERRSRLGRFAPRWLPLRAE